MADGKGEDYKVLPPPVQVADEYLAEILRTQREILEILKKNTQPMAVPAGVTHVKEPVKKGR